jgi:GNAT superfamily N-acetyltransferase
MPDATLRPACAADAAALGAVQVQAWQESYRGLLADGYLDRLSVARRTRQWCRMLAAPPPHWQALVLEDGAGLAGFGIAGPHRESGRAAPAEVMALYVLRRQQRRGWGRAIMQRLAAGAAAWGAPSLELWALSGNAAAVAFYAGLGGQPGEERTFRIARRRVLERAFLWPDLRRLTGAVQ